PDIVFFQEAVPNFDPATRIVAEADIFVIIGTSLVVYPAAALINYVRRGVPVFYIDPRPSDVPEGVHIIRTGAGEGVARLAEILRKSYL
ncbi:MAG TPA: Sir2 family NAD-dependent protein deacetylase, partial [Muribaculaceae bacterium]|nr:Sir2 family NAD-dependent protein deacetylase [Muribaculaceae bacterium]